jgi:hypothetical protein
MRGHVCDRCGAPYINHNQDYMLCAPCFFGLPTDEAKRLIETGNRT